MVHGASGCSDHSESGETMHGFLSAHLHGLVLLAGRADEPIGALNGLKRDVTLFHASLVEQKTLHVLVADVRQTLLAAFLSEIQQEKHVTGHFEYGSPLMPTK